MKPVKFMAVLLFATSLFALSPYIKGFRDYIRYVKYSTGHEIKSPYLLKKLGINTPKQLNTYFKNGAALLLKKAAEINPKIEEGLKKIIKKGDLKDLKVFWVNIINGKIPPG